MVSAQQLQHLQLSACWALFPFLLKDFCSSGDHAETQHPLASWMRQVCLWGGLETVWGDVIEVVHGFLLKALLLHTGLLCSVMV